MAKNDENNRDSRNHDNRNHVSGANHQAHGTTDAARDRRRDRVVNTVKERPYAAAALATVAAGAAAFFLTRGKSDKPLMNWGQDTPGDHVKGAGAYKQQGSTSSDRSLETSSASPSSSAGLGAGTGGTSPSAVQAASLSKSGSSTNASTTGGMGTSSSVGGTSAAGSSNNRNTGTSNTSGAGVSGRSNASGGGKTGDTGLDQASRNETKTGAISYGA
nr:hypothetical protein [uncultured Sphingomonas sp.]